jgi:hypothetical protein
MKARLGDTVIIFGVHSNGATEHPAIITRLWGQSDPGVTPLHINVHVLPDDYVSHTRSSVMLYGSLKQATDAGALLPFCYQRGCACSKSST